MTTLKQVLNEIAIAHLRRKGGIKRDASDKHEQIKLSV